MRWDRLSKLWFARTRSIRSSRPSSSVSFCTTGSSSGGVLAQPTSSAHAASGRNDRERSACSFIIMSGCSARVDELDAAILRIRGLVAPLHCGALLAIAHGRNLRFGDSLQHQRTPYGLCAAFAQTDVVLARAAFVRVPFEADPPIRTAIQIFRMSGDDRDELGLDLGPVVVEVNNGPYALCFLQRGLICAQHATRDIAVERPAGIGRARLLWHLTLGDRLRLFRTPRECQAAQHDQQKLRYTHSVPLGTKGLKSGDGPAARVHHRRFARLEAAKFCHKPLHATTTTTCRDSPAARLHVSLTAERASRAETATTPVRAHRPSWRPASG